MKWIFWKRHTHRHFVAELVRMDMKAKLMKTLDRDVFTYELEFFLRGERNTWKAVGCIRLTDGPKAINLIAQADKFLQGVGR